MSLGVATRALEKLNSRDCTNKPHYWTALSKVRVGRDSRAKTTDEPSNSDISTLITSSYIGLSDFNSHIEVTKISLSLVLRALCPSSSFREDNPGSNTEGQGAL